MLAHARGPTKPAGPPPVNELAAHRGSTSLPPIGGSVHPDRVAQSVGYAAGAEDNALARWLGARINRAVERSARARGEVAATRAVVSVVVPDRRLAATLRFDHGIVTVHDGLAGVPDLTFCADYSYVEQLGALSAPSWRTLRRPIHASGRDARERWLSIGAAILDGRIEIYGALAHPRLLVRLLRLVSTVD